MNAFDYPALEAALPGFALACFLLMVFPFVPVTNRPVRAVAAAASIVAMLWYLQWRVTATLPQAGLSLEYAVGVLFLIIEASALIGSAITFTTISRTKNRSGEIDAANAAGIDGATAQVDVLICTYSEEADIVERTIRCAMAMNHKRKRVWVADDGRRAWLKSMCADLGCGYITRPDNSHAKAGNINHALDQLGTLAVVPDYVMILDADFAPRRDFLARTLPVFADPKVAIVQTPQNFHNPDPIQANLRTARFWPDEQRFFFDTILPAKDAWGTAFCCGTSSVIDFRVLMQAGGFATFSVTEDYLLTVKMKEFGYQTAYVHERLSLGLAPEGLKEYVTQRSRWCLGLIQICMSNRGPFARGNGLRLSDRISLIESFAFWAGVHAFRIMCVIVPALYLVFGIKAVQADYLVAIQHFLPAYVMQLGFVVWVSRGRIMPVLTDVSQLLCAPTIIRSVWSGVCDPENHSFKVTAKGGDRSKVVVQWRPFIFFAALLALTAFGIYRTFVFNGGMLAEPSSTISLVWGWYNIIVLAICCLVCIELPRAANAWLAGEEATLKTAAADHAHEVTIVDACTTGVMCQFDNTQAALPFAVGERAEIIVDGHRYNAVVQREASNGLFYLTLATDRSSLPLWQAVFERQFHVPTITIEPRRIAGAILARAVAD